VCGGKDFYITEIPLIIAPGKEHPCFVGEDSACPPGPPLRTMMVLLLPSPLFYPFLGEPGGGGENPMNIGFFEHFSRAVIMELSHGFSYPECSRERDYYILQDAVRSPFLK
jgi:hypothetical protein